MTAHLSAVETDEKRFAYPYGPEDRLNGHWFMMLDFTRYLDSDFRMKACLEVRGAALELMLLAQRQTPVGTLPVARNLLARHLGINASDFDRLCLHDPSPLHGWQECETPDRQIRLYHPVVLEHLEKARDRRAEHKGRADKNARRARIRRLDEWLRPTRFGQIHEFATFLEMCEDYLTEHGPQRRSEEWALKAARAVYEAPVVPVKTS